MTTTRTINVTPRGVETLAAAVRINDERGSITITEDEGGRTVWVDPKWNATLTLDANLGTLTHEM